MGVFKLDVLKKIVFGLAGLMVLVVLIAFLLPRHVELERSIVINAPQERVYGYLDSFERFNEWSPWAAMDPATQYEYSGPAQGVGAYMAWKSDNPNVGNGSQKITAAQPYSLVKTFLDFGEQGTAEAAFKLAPAEGQGGYTRVTWDFSTDLGYNPVMRYMGLMFDSMLGPQYEQGLASLKELVEREAGAPAE